MMGHPSHPPRWGTMADLRPHLERLDRRRRRRDLLLWVAAWAVLVLLGSILQRAEACEPHGLAFEAGIGVHDPGFDGPEYTTRNPLGILEARYHAGPFVWAFTHTSSLEGFPAVFDSPNEHGYGSNVLSVRWRWAP